ncbi:MAG: hypothetical protein HY901_25355 [Deltaproteobacteria bacterium]|nr:hypothetical protein [Deltaproteobacteria bacterium]
MAGIRALAPAVATKYSPAGARANEEVDGNLAVSLGRPHRRLEYSVHIKRSHLSYALVSGLVTRLRDKPTHLLLAPYIASPMGRHLADHGLSYADAVGNLHLLGPDGRSLVAHVEGKVQQRSPAVRGLGIPAHLVNFALLAKPALVSAPIREVAAAAGVSKSSVANQVARLSAQGLLATARGHSQLVRPRDLLDRWLNAYVESVRPRWLVGRFHTQADVEELQRSLPGALAAITWALSGTGAAWRMTRFYRGEETVLLVDSPPPDIAKRLRALPSESGKLTILKLGMPLAFEGVEPNLAHPLLVYSELLASRDPRTRDTAEGIRERFLSELE